MTVYSSFQYWRTAEADADGSFQPTFDALSARADQLIVVDAGITSDTVSHVLTTSQIAALTARGRRVPGHLNAPVTDRNRSCWDDAGINPEDRDGTNPDAGTPNARAPDWLAHPVGLATGMGGDGDAYMLGVAGAGGEMLPGGSGDDAIHGHDLPDNFAV